MQEKITIVIAEDNQDFANVISKYLNNQKDMEVIGIAKDGEAAIDLILTKEPDVALLDVIMPHLDGLRST